MMCVQSEAVHLYQYPHEGSGSTVEEGEERMEELEDGENSQMAVFWTGHGCCSHELTAAVVGYLYKICPQWSASTFQNSQERDG